LQRQVLQQKLEAEIIAKKEQHLTVYQKSSVDGGDEDDDDAGDSRTNVIS
jgi:hypothetical protein